MALGTILPAAHGFLVKTLHDAERGNIAMIKISMLLDILGVSAIAFTPSPAGVFAGEFSQPHHQCVIDNL